MKQTTNSIIALTVAALFQSASLFGASAGDLSGSIAIPDNFAVSSTSSISDPYGGFQPMAFGQGRNPMGGGFPGNGPGHGGPHGKRPKLTTEQKSAMDACLVSKGITPPTPPTEGQVWTQPPAAPSEENKAAFKACHEQVLGNSLPERSSLGGGSEAFRSCLQQQGISGVNLTDQQRSAIQACRQQNQGLYGDALDMCILGQGVALPELSANTVQAISTCKAQVLGQ